MNNLPANPNVKSSNTVSHLETVVALDTILTRSSFCRESLAERDEILKHKWLESEKAGRDIGFGPALTSWVIWHRTNWRKARKLGRA